MKSITFVVLLAAGLGIFAADPVRPKSTEPADAKYKKATGELWATYVAELAEIQEEYIKELLIDHEAAVKRKDLDEAQRILAVVKDVQDEMKSLKAAPVGNPLAKGSVWRGTGTFDGKDYPAALTISSRNGEQFQGTLEWNLEATGHAVTLVEGKVAGEDVTFEIKKIQKGNNVLLATYTGKLVGRRLSGNWSALESKVKGEFSYKQVR
jgi:hypothetical protein